MGGAGGVWHKLEREDNVKFYKAVRVVDADDPNKVKVKRKQT
jgi:hypothetical protein